MAHEIVWYRNTMDIRDLDGLAGLLVEQMRFIGYEHDSTFVKAMLHNAMKQGSNAVLFAAYDENGKTVACAFGNICCGLECGGDYLWLNELYVAQNHRHEHIASAMLTFIEQWAVSIGCVYVAMVTHPRNSAAQQLYSNSGYELEQLVWVDKYL